MAEATKTAVKKSVAAVEETAASVYERLCGKIDIAPMSGSVNISGFSDSKRMAESPFDERLTAAISVFLEMAGKSGTAIDRIDRGLLDHYISQIDVTISGQLAQAVLLARQALA